MDYEKDERDMPNKEDFLPSKLELIEKAMNEYDRNSDIKNEIIISTIRDILRGSLNGNNRLEGMEKD